jgi:hypothetical protein
MVKFMLSCMRLTSQALRSLCYNKATALAVRTVLGIPRAAVENDSVLLAELLEGEVDRLGHQPRVVQLLVEHKAPLPRFAIVSTSVTIHLMVCVVFRAV